MSLVSVLHPLLFVFLLFQVSAYGNTKDSLELQIILYQLNFLDAMVRGWVDIFLAFPPLPSICSLLGIRSSYKEQKASFSTFLLYVIFIYEKIICKTQGQYLFL